MTILGCGAEMAKLMAVSDEDVQTIEDVLKERLDMGIARPEAQRQAVAEAIAMLGNERAMVMGAISAKVAALQKAAEPIQATHQDPGAKPEAATAPVISESLIKAAKKEERPLAEMKAELLGMIDAAVKLTPDYQDHMAAIEKVGKEQADAIYTGLNYRNSQKTVEGKGRITFDVPGDGKFTVVNSYAGLMAFRAKIAKAHGNGFSETKRPGLPASTSVKKGSTNQISAIESMLEDGDLQAAKDYMAAVGIGTDGLKKSALDRMEQLEALGDKAQEALYTRIDPEWQYSVDRGSRRANLIRTIGKDVYRAYVIGGTKNDAPADFQSATYGISKNNEKEKLGSSGNFHDALVAVQTALEKLADKTGTESQNTTASKAKDTEKVSGAPAELDLMGFTKTPIGNGTFTLSDSNMRVTVEPTGTGFQARMGSAKSGPRLTEQESIEWASALRDESIRIQKAETKAKPEVSKTGKLPVFPVDAYRLERFYANGAKIKPLPARTFSLQEIQSITDWFKSIGWSVTSGSGGNGINATNDIGMTIDDLPEPYTAAQRKKDEALLASDERAAAKKKEQEGYLASTAAGKFVAGMFGDAMNRSNQVALAKVLSGDEKTFAGLFSNSAVDVLSEAGISAEGREIKDVIRDIKAMFDTAPTSSAKEPWQMTEAEFGEVERLKALANTKYDLERAKNGSLKPFVSGDKSKPALVRRLTAEVAQIEAAKPEGYAGDHLAHINKALREGKPVPEVNLKRYDIAAPAGVDMDPAEFKRRLDVYNQTLQAELDKEIPVDAAHVQALGMAGLTGDGLRKARVQNGLPNTDKAGTWGLAEKQSIANQTFDKTAQGAIEAFNADDADQAVAIMAKLKIDDLKDVGAEIGFRPHIGENAKAFRERIGAVADKLTKTNREQSAREMKLFNRLTQLATDYDRAITHRDRAIANGVEQGSTAFEGSYEGQWTTIDNGLNLLTKALQDESKSPDFVKVAEMVRKARPAIFDAEEAEPDGRLLKKDAPTQARRTNPAQTIEFKNPIVGPSGEKLVSYTWQWKPFEYVDKTGEERTGKLSDWDKSAGNVDTGREVVHQFTVESKDGETRIVSAESAIAALGYADKVSEGSAKSAISAAKTLARNKMQLAELESALSAFMADQAEVNKLALPEVTRGIGGWWAMGDSTVRQTSQLFPNSQPGELLPERMKVLEDGWRSNRLSERGWNLATENTLKEGIYDTNAQIKRAQAKLDSMATQDTATPEQKAPTEDGNVAMFSRGTPFYSELSRQIEAANINAAPGFGWKAALKGLMAKGVKADEITWSGIEEWLDLQTGKVTKASVLDFLAANGVQVTETTLGNTKTQLKAKQVSALSTEELAAFPGNENMEPTDWLMLNNGMFVGTYLGGAQSESEAVAAYLEEADAEMYEGVRSEDDVKYSKYQLPGGQNYREVLLTLPASKAKTERVLRGSMEYRKDDSGNWNIWDRDGFVFKSGFKTRDEVVSWAEDDDQLTHIPNERGYQSSHWSQPNVLAHIRVNDRTDSDGKRVLFVEEIQSDFGQDTKKQRDAINRAVDDDFTGIIERMKKAGVLQVECD